MCILYHFWPYFLVLPPAVHLFIWLVLLWIDCVRNVWREITGILSQRMQPFMIILNSCHCSLEIILPVSSFEHENKMQWCKRANFLNKRRKRIAVHLTTIEEESTFYDTLSKWGGSLSSEDDKIIASWKNESQSLNAGPLNRVQHFQLNKITLYLSTTAVVMLWDK